MSLLHIFGVSKLLKKITTTRLWTEKVAIIFSSAMRPLGKCCLIASKSALQCISRTRGAFVCNCLTPKLLHAYTKYPISSRTKLVGSNSIMVSSQNIRQSPELCQLLSAKPPTNVVSRFSTKTSLLNLNRQCVLNNNRTAQQFIRSQLLQYGSLKKNGK